MSSYDESMEDFIVASDSGSDFEEAPPVKKAKKSPVAKTTAAKPKAKPAAGTSKTGATKKTTDKPKATSTASKPKKKNVVSDDESDAVVSRKPSKPVAADSDAENIGIDDDDSDSEDESASSKKKATTSKPPAKKAGEKTASDKYQKLTQIEHVLKRPDTYIGSIEAQTQPMWVYNTKTDGIVYRNTTYVPGLYKIFDEILVNAADNKRNDASMDTIKVVIDRDNGLISVWNNGRGIPVEIHAKEGIYIPELIFSHLLAGSNFDDNEKKITGGRNGYGAKLANIFSTEFIVETADAKNAKKYKQVFENNMSKKGKAKITDNKKGEEWTKITFKPDFAKFGMPDGIDDDTEALLKKRVYDMAGTVAGIKVSLNDTRVKIKNFKSYVEMYTQATNEVLNEKASKKGAKTGQKRDRDGSAAAGAAPGDGEEAAAAVNKVPLVYERFGERWEVAFAPSEGQFQQVSFVNSIATTKGGTHVDYISKQIVDGIIESISKKAKKQVTTIKPFTVKNHLWVFVNCLVENAAFDSQTKENMTLAASKFGSKCAISEGFLKKVIATGVIDSVMSLAQFKQDQLMKKTDGHKHTRMLGIAKLEDANQAGTKNARNCTLILTEGDSAKTFAVSGLAIVGRDTYGIFPLRGKLLNVRDANGKQLLENVEIQNLKKILGLQHGKSYTSVDSLRYGRLMIMTDQDHDGSHIKGLIINFLDHAYPGLLQIPGFLVEFITPIVRVTKGSRSHSFFTLPEYEAWKAENNEARGWKMKYFKGLGTSTGTDAKSYFSDLKRHMLKFKTCSAGDRQLIDLVFNKKKADDRKEWLRGFVPGTYLDPSIKEIPIQDFINRELILFSMADNMRSIPSVVDGLKPGQRKVLYGCFKKNLKGEIKVAQLVGYISEVTAYHHGEQALAGTIVGLAQVFVGNNNLNTLLPNGQFGTRLQGGKDSASPRYIYTALAPITRAVFNKHDDAVLDYLNEDGATIEPTWYMPTLPMLLVNGSDGIGTGWSSSVPNYNPSDIIANLRRKMAGEPMERMMPWFRGFTGMIEANGPDRFTTYGIAEQVNDDTVVIYELPVRTWTNSYVEQLLAWSQSTEKQPAIVREFVSQSTDLVVHLTVTLTAEGKAAVKKDGLEKTLKLTSSLATSNMVCFDVNGKIKKYASPEEIIADFYDVRLTYYMKRKDYMVGELTIAHDRLSNQARFITMFIAGQLKISGREHASVVRDLRKLQFKPFPKVAKVIVAGDPDASGLVDPADLISDDDDDMDGLLEETHDQSNAGGLHDFDYLLDMTISSLTAAKAKRLLAQRDEKEKELQVLLDLSPKAMWNRDLDEFEAQWNALLAADEATISKATLKGKGKVGSMRPGAGTITAAFARIAQNKKTADANAGTSAATAKPRIGLKSSPAAGLAAKKKKAAAIKYESDFDSEAEEHDFTLRDDTSEDEKIKPAGKGKAKAIIQDSEEEDQGSMSDVNREEVHQPKAEARKPAPPAAKPKAVEKVANTRAPAKPARKVIDLDSDSEEESEDDQSASDASMEEDESFYESPKAKKSKK